MKALSKPIAILGAGAWGTALSVLLARNDQPVRLWSIETDQLRTMEKTRRNDVYLPGVHLSNPIQICFELKEALMGVQDILMVVPSHVFRSVLKESQPYLPSTVRIAWGSKGLDPSGLLLHQVVMELLGEKVPMAALSGPTFAKEVAAGLPTAITVATNTPSFAHDLMACLQNKNFHVYPSTDIIGVQVGGMVKNILAIAVGILDGRGYGSNARCALMTFGLAEMTQLGIALGGQKDTFYGLSGLGDTILTCTDDQSRNRRFGLALGKNLNAKEVEQDMGQVVEGARNATEVYQLAKRLKVSMPIVETIYRILHENLSLEEAVVVLMEGS